MTVACAVQMNTAIPTTATPYTAGDCVGGIISEYPGASLPGFGSLLSMLVADASNQGAAFTAMFFSARPTGTWTDNLAASPSAADIAALVGVIGIGTADYVTIDSKKYACVAVQTGVRWNVAVDGSTPILYMTVVTGGTPTYGANSTSLGICLSLVPGHRT